MAFSARNQLSATVVELNAGGSWRNSSCISNADELVAAIPRRSAERLDLQPGERVCAVIKATEITVSTD